MPRSIEEEERAWQNERGGLLQEDAYDRPGTREVHDAQFARIAEAAALGPSMRLLDIGCGVGHLVRWLAQHSKATLHGLDISTGSLARARELMPGIGWTTGSAETLPYRGDTFDRIVCNGSAHHIVDKHAAFREMYRVMKPGGRMVLHEPAATLFTTAIRSVFVRSEKFESPVDLAHKEDFTARSAETLLANAGFAGFAHSRHDFLAYPLSGNYFHSPLSSSRRLMRFLLGVESSLARTPLRSVFNPFAWRTLLVCTKPPLGRSSQEGATV